jgi:hypothetical protein
VPAATVLHHAALHAEVFLGQPYNEKADVFSFGVVLYGELGPSWCGAVW